ncbi:Splicing factor 3b, subunit 2 [Ceraceosorus bombacis]|uniref:Splicing factor 3b, subunit 2 n=1 Tax=Ceraceosorus bombacis TaxID=401625 RepID=A0A0N7L9P2_9BASI|nr:Splicing factor 3b, subunit 2 [Ceraceosorus bombacis]
MAVAQATTSDPTSQFTNGHALSNGAHKGGGKGKTPLTKNAKRRAKRKQDGHDVSESESDREASVTPAPSAGNGKTNTLAGSSADGEASGSRSTSAMFDLSSLAEAPAPDDPAFAEFQSVFAAFKGDEGVEGQAGGVDGSGNTKGEVIYSDDDQLSDSEGEEGADGAAIEAAVLSKRKQRKLQRLSVAELKQLTVKPELVDQADVTAKDPLLLLQLKGTRNAVPVPPHWNQKRAYLQNKRGIEKPPYLLPSYIAATGIAEMKDALKEKEGDQSLKAKTRERVQPKMGKVDIDYQKLHDAFFKFQHRPDSLTGYGETYYEGKEYETKFTQRKPGAELSNELKEALSIPPLAPPPWLIAMQRFGPPPSYPHIKIPGLNAPIPQGAQWGFHPGGWGRPPLDEWGIPIYGDVLGTGEEQTKEAQQAFEDEVRRDRWGELEPEEEEEEDEENEEDEEDEEQEMDQDAQIREGLETPLPEGLETPGGFQSVTSTVPGGLETPDFIELRKGARGASSQYGSETPEQRNLYQVVPEHQNIPGGAGKGFMPSDRGYDFASLATAGDGGNVLGREDHRSNKRKADDVQLALSPEEMQGLSKEELQARYDAARAKKGEKFRF